MMYVSYACYDYTICSSFNIACRLVAKVQDAGGLHIATEQVKKFKGVPSGATASPMQNRRLRRKSGIFNTNVSV